MIAMWVNVGLTIVTAGVFSDVGEKKNYKFIEPSEIPAKIHTKTRG